MSHNIFPILALFNNNAFPSSTTVVCSEKTFCLNKTIPICYKFLKERPDIRLVLATKQIFRWLNLNTHGASERK